MEFKRRMWKYINYIRVITNEIMRYVNIKTTSTVRFKVSHTVFGLTTLLHLRRSAYFVCTFHSKMFVKVWDFKRFKQYQYFRFIFAIRLMTAMYWSKHVAVCMCKWKLCLKGLCYFAAYIGNSWDESSSAQRLRFTLNYT